MHTTDPACELIRHQLAACADAGRTPPADVMEHLRQCADCREFHNFWSGSFPRQLAAEPPGAGLDLRRRILALPEALPEAGRPSVPARNPWRRITPVLSSLAAVLLVSLLVHSLLRPPAPPRERTAQSPSQLSQALAAEQELAAIDKDLHQGLAGLSAPVRSLRSLLHP